MINNYSHTSPAKINFAFNSQANILFNKTIPASEVTITLKNSDGSSLGVIYKGTDARIDNLFCLANQSLEVDITGGGNVFANILEANTTLTKGINFSKQSYKGDGIIKEFDIFIDTDNKALVKVFIEGLEFSDFTLRDSKVIFKEAPFKDCEITIFTHITQE